MSEFVKIRSWHIIRTWTRVPRRAVTLCGRRAEGESADTLPMDEKSCESCLRIAAKRSEAP